MIGNGNLNVPASRENDKKSPSKAHGKVQASATELNKVPKSH